MSLIFIGTLGFGIGVFWGIVEGYYNRKLEKVNQLEKDFKETSDYLKQKLNLYTEDEINRLIEEEKKYNSDKAEMNTGIQSMILKIQSEIEELKWINNDFVNAEIYINSVKNHLTGTSYSVTDSVSGRSAEMTNEELDPYLNSIIRRNHTLSVKLEKLLDVCEFVDNELQEVGNKKCVPECFGTCKSQDGEQA